MIRIASLILLLAALAALSGCSVFGIATKGELETAIQQEAVQQRELEASLADLSEELEASRADLAALDRRLRPRLASLDSALAENTEQVAAATRQWNAMQAALVLHLDSLSTEYRLLGRDVAVVREGITTVGAQAAKARVASRQAMQIHYETLIEERDRLLEQLEALDQRLQTWPTPADSTAAVPDGITAAARPEAGKIDIRVVTPEQPTVADGAGGS